MTPAPKRTGLYFPCSHGEPSFHELAAEVSEARTELMRLARGFNWGVGALREQMESRGYRSSVVSIALFGLLNDGELTADSEWVIRTYAPPISPEEGSTHG